MVCSSAAAEQAVSFQAAAARAGLPAAQEAGIRGYLTKPAGGGPFPAVVLLHTCLGLPANYRAIADRIAGWGYVALFVDDFAGRGLKQTCLVDFPEGLADAFGALRFLTSSPDVDPTRIAAVGFSQGADTALSISTLRFPAVFAPRGGPGFKAVAAFYPPCANQGGARLTLPTLILIGEQDTVTPAADCERLANAQPRAAPGVRVVVYPGAAHGFDNPGFSRDAPVLGMTLRYDRRSAQQSWRALEEFLAAHLMR